jgi:hypothetical protein
VSSLDCAARARIRRRRAWARRYIRVDPYPGAAGTIDARERWVGVGGDPGPGPGLDTPEAARLVHGEEGLVHGLMVAVDHVARVLDQPRLHRRDHAQLCSA